jgi:hypothetical protein
MIVEANSMVLGTVIDFPDIFIEQFSEARQAIQEGVDDLTLYLCSFKRGELLKRKF